MRQALELALEALKYMDNHYISLPQVGMQAITAIKEALAQPEQEPVAWMNNKDFEPIRVRIMQEAYELADRNDSEGYNAIKVMCGDVQRMLPPQRTWVGLTDEDRAEILNRKWWNFEDEFDVDGFLRLAEAKLKEKNT